MKPQSIFFVVTFVVLAGSTALAQSHPPAAVDPKACAPGERTLPPDATQHSIKPPATTGEASQGGNLSDKLARTDGVICPENVDPSIKAPTPQTGRMPVIPPPGSPGGDPTVRPK